MKKYTESINPKSTDSNSNGGADEQRREYRRIYSPSMIQCFQILFEIPHYKS